MATAPVLFAAEEFPELNALIARRFDQPGDVQRAAHCVHRSQGLRKTRELAVKHCEVGVELTRIMSHIFYCMHALYSSHTNTTNRCHKLTTLVKEATSSFLGGETCDCISNVPSLTVGVKHCGVGDNFSREYLCMCVYL